MERNHASQANMELVMRDFEILFFRSNHLVSRAWYPAMKRGDACRFARALLSVRSADAFQVSEV